MNDRTGSAAWLEGLLRARLGPDATLGAVTFEGRVVHVDGARVPLGGAVIAVGRLTVELGAGLPLPGIPLSARLVALQAELRVAGRVFPISFTEGPEAEASWVHGTLRVGASPGLDVIVVDLDLAAVGSPASGRICAREIRVARAGGAALVLTDVSVEIEIDRGGLRYRDLRGAGGGARFAGWGHVPFAAGSEATAVPLAALRIDRAGAALIAGIAGAAGLAWSPPVPPDVAITGELMLSADHAASGSFAVETPRSALLFQLTLGPGRELLGSTLRGRFTAADAIAVGLVTGPVHPQQNDVFALDARLSGTLARPGITGRLSVARVSLEVASTIVVCEDASVLLDVDRDRLAWQGLAGRLYGGRFSSSGKLAFRAGALDAAVVWSGVRVEDLPGRTAAERALATVLRGEASGELRFERVGAVALAARGRLEIADPVYLAVRRVAPVLLRYGLPPVPARGTRPVTAVVRLERGEITVEPISAAVDGIDVDGALRLGPGGRLAGRVRVHLLEGYLGRSPLLAIPAAFAGRVIIPVHLGGTTSAPEVRANAVEILDGLLHASRVRDALKSVLDSLSSAARAPRRRR